MHCSDRISLASQRARLWLLDVLPKVLFSDDAKLEDPMRALLGAWLSERILESGGGGGDDTLRRAGELVYAKLHEAAVRGALDPWALDASLVIMTRHILHICGLSVRSLEEFCVEVGRAIDLLPELPGRLAGEALLLSSGGLCTEPVAAPFETQNREIVAMSLLRADESRIRSICSDIASATLFGASDVVLPASDLEQIVYGLEIALLQSMRSYDLELATAIMRTLCFLREADGSVMELCLTFLLDQQRADGKFGHFDAELDQMSQDVGAADGAMARRLYIATTVSCLWVIAEMANIRLFHSFRCGPSALIRSA